MIRRSPAEYYIKYLLLHPNRYSDEDVENALYRYHLDYPGGTYLSRLRQQMEVPIQFFPYDELHFASYRFLCQHKVLRAFHQDEPMRDAVKILESPRAKELVETMLITQDPEALVCHRLESLGMRASCEALKRYAHYFWNLSLIDGTELRALLDMRYKQTMFEGDTVKDVARGNAMKKAAYMDPRWLAANAPDARTASLMNQIRNGYLPSHFDMTKLVTSLIALAMVRTEHELISGGPESAMRARDFTTVAHNLHTLLADMGSPSDNLLSELTTMGVTLQHGDAVVPTIGQLTEGNYSAELQAVGAEETHNE